MNTDHNPTDEHVGEALSGYLDGELTQQERQKVQLHCEQCSQCRNDLEQMQALRERVNTSRLSVIGEDQWRENMNESGVQTSAKLGWMLFIGGMLIAVAAGVYGVLGAATTMPLWMTLMMAGIYGGLLVLLYSVLRQRLIERKTDKYKDVEI